MDNATDYKKLVSMLEEGIEQTLPMWETNMETVKTLLDDNFIHHPVKVRINYGHIRFIPYGRFVKKDNSLPEIMEKCSKAFNVSVEDIKSSNRQPAMVFARQAYCYLGSKSGYVKSIVGKYIGRSHSTVSYSETMVNNYIDTNYRPFLDCFEKLEQIKNTYNG